MTTARPAETGENRSLWALALPVAALTGLSFMRFHAAGSLSTDHGSHDLLPASMLAVGVITALAAAGFLTSKAARKAGNGRADRAFVDRVTIVALALSCFAVPMLPLLSNDIFSLLAYSDLAFNHGVNPFVPPGELLAASAFAGLVSPAWSNAPSMYGPVTLTWVAPAVIWGAGDPGMTMFLVKVTAGLTVTVLVLLLRSAALGLDRPLRRDHLVMVMVAPLLWIEGTGQVHTDLLLAAVLAGWMVAASKGRVLPACALLGIATATRMTALVPAGLYLVWLLADPAVSVQTRILRSAALSALMAAVVVFSYMPFGNLADSLAAPLTWLVHRPPTNTIYEGFWRAAMLIGRDADGIEAIIYRVVQVQVLGVSLAAVLLAFRASGFGRLVAITAMTGLFLGTIFTPIHHAWYMLPFLPMLLAVRDDRWIRWVLWMSLAGSACGVSDLFATEGTVPLIFRLVTITGACVGSLAWLAYRLRSWIDPGRPLTGQAQPMASASSEHTQK